MNLKKKSLTSELQLFYSPQLNSIFLSVILFKKYRLMPQVITQTLRADLIKGRTTVVEVFDSEVRTLLDSPDSYASIPMERSQISEFLKTGGVFSE